LVIWLAAAEIELAAIVALAVLLACISFVDVREQRIPDILNAALLIVGLAASQALVRHSIVWGLTSVIICFSVFLAVRVIYAQVRSRQGLGLGDVKFAGAAGAWIGIEGLPTMVLVASVLALLTVAIASSSGRPIASDSRLPFGPFLSIGLVAVWLVGPY
jgi:leader peptidase (prepilin peptidase) / N-methyltransferase